MLIRQSLNFAAHFAAGIAVGALMVAALTRQRRRRDEDVELGPMPAAEPATPPPTTPPPTTPPPRRPGSPA